MEKKYKTLDKKLNTLTRTKIQNQHHDIRFYPRVINKTNINFTDSEITLLNKGLKYNLGYKNKHWLSNFAFEAESIISQLPINEHECVRYRVAQNLQKIIQTTQGKAPDR